MSDFPVYDLPFMVARNKDRAYRERCRARYVALQGFLSKNELFTLARPAVTLEDLAGSEKIMWSELNEKGMAVIKKGLDKWLRAQDKGKLPEDVSVLEKALSVAQ